MSDRLDRKTMEYVYTLCGFELRVAANVPAAVRCQMAALWGRKVAWSLGVPR